MYVCTECDSIMPMKATICFYCGGSVKSQSNKKMVINKSDIEHDITLRDLVTKPIYSIQIKVYRNYWTTIHSSGGSFHPAMYHWCRGRHEYERLGDRLREELEAVIAENGTTLHQGWGAFVTHEHSFNKEDINPVKINETVTAFIQYANSLNETDKMLFVLNCSNMLEPSIPIKVGSRIIPADRQQLMAYLLLDTATSTNVTLEYDKDWGWRAMFAQENKHTSRIHEMRDDYREMRARYVAD